MSRRKVKKSQKIKIDGFRFPQQLLEELRALSKKGTRIPSSAYATLLVILKQIHIERSSKGYVQELILAKWAKELDMAYSSLHAGRVFLEEHGFFYEEILPSGKPAWTLKNYKEFTTPELPTEQQLNYFLVPHTLFNTNIIAEFVRTSNSKAFELMFSLFNQFRHGVAKVESKEAISRISYDRNMSTLKEHLGKRAKAVREVLEILQPLFDIQYIDINVRGKQLWIRKVNFVLKAECVKENTDEFFIEPLVSAYQENTQYLLDSLGLRYKSRDLFDIVLSFKQEVVDKLKYITDTDQGDYQYNYRDSWLQQFFYESLTRFETHIKKQLQERGKFSFSTSIGAYFRTIFRKALPTALETIPYEILNDAKFNEYKATLKTPALYSI